MPRPARTNLSASSSLACSANLRAFPSHRHLDNCSPSPKCLPRRRTSPATNTPTLRGERIAAQSVHAQAQKWLLSRGLAKKNILDRPQSCTLPNTGTSECEGLLSTHQKWRGVISPREDLLTGTIQCRKASVPLTKCTLHRVLQRRMHESQQTTAPQFFALASIPPQTD